MPRALAKQLAFQVLGSGFRLRRRRLAIARSGAVTILNLHRVSGDDGSDYRPLSPALFDDLLGFLTRHFALVTFADRDEPASLPKLILSFDDGYRDFLEVAVPILAKHRVRVNHNIIPACTESGLPPLNVMAQDFVGKAPGELVRRLDVPGFDMSDPRRVGFRLSAYLKNKSHAEQEELSRKLVPQFYAWAPFTATPMMTREEVRQVGEAHELGGHSFSHASMEHESDDYLRDDVTRCQSYFETCFGQTMNIYAFPNGSCRPGQIDIVREAGVAHVLLVGESFDVEPAVHRRFTFDAVGGREARFKALGGLKPLPA